VFAAAMMSLIGVFDIIGGLVAIFDDDWRLGSNGELFIVSDTAWGWLTVIIGIIILFAASAVMRGLVWGRTIAVIMALGNAIVHLSLIRAYPIWSLLIITLNVFVIYGVTVHGGELRED
jgi:hypothetical protein